MKATIDGMPFSLTTTRKEGLALRLFRHLHDYGPENRGCHVLIEVEDEELFEGFGEKSGGQPKPEEVLAAMKFLAENANELYLASIDGFVPFDHANNISLPDLRDVKLQVVNMGMWVTGQGLVDPKPMFQILTQKWVGPIALDGDYINTRCCIPVG